MGCNLPVAIGRSGISKKTGEGDGITPAGNFSVMGIDFRNDRISLNLQMLR
jgi:L,D-peptidoglycan transpeptidase YkuD (ErfK/YbiS/YcfS/YnhG family)